MKVLSSEIKKWHVIYCRYRYEKKADGILLRKGIESWCPMNKTERQWKDRKKVIEEPLFKSYVFVKITEQDKLTVLMTEGVLNFVHYLKKPAIIRDEEINNIRLYLAQEDAELEIIPTENFNENSKVRITRGVFMDSAGTVIRGGKKKVYVQLESLGQVMVVQFQAEHLIKIA